jgi:hypothetical protein
LKGSLGLAGVFAVLSQGIDWEHLPSLGAQVVELAGARAPGGHPGPAALQAALRAPDEEARSYRRAALTQALCTDLCASSLRLVFIYDTFNDADPEVEEWLLGSFLQSVRYSSNLVAVVAGRPPLKERTTWAARCACIRLSRIDDARAWHTGLRELCPSLGVSLQELKFLCECLRGHPQEIGMALANVIQTRSVAASGGGRP